MMQNVVAMQLFTDAVPVAPQAGKGVTAGSSLKAGATGFGELLKERVESLTAEGRGAQDAPLEAGSGVEPAGQQVALTEKDPAALLSQEIAAEPKGVSGQAEPASPAPVLGANPAWSKQKPSASAAELPATEASPVLPAVALAVVVAARAPEAAATPARAENAEKTDGSDRVEERPAQDRAQTPAPLLVLPQAPVVSQPVTVGTEKEVPESTDQVASLPATAAAVKAAPGPELPVARELRNAPPVDRGEEAPVARFRAEQGSYRAQVPGGYAPVQQRAEAVPQQSAAKAVAMQAPAETAVRVEAPATPVAREGGNPSGEQQETVSAQAEPALRTVRAEVAASAAPRQVVAAQAKAAAEAPAAVAEAKVETKAEANVETKAEVKAETKAETEGAAPQQTRVRASQQEAPEVRPENSSTPAASERPVLRVVSRAADESPRQTTGGREMEAVRAGVNVSTPAAVETSATVVREPAAGAFVALPVIDRGFQAANGPAQREAAPKLATTGTDSGPELQVARPEPKLEVREAVREPLSPAGEGARSGSENRQEGATATQTEARGREAVASGTKLAEGARGEIAEPAKTEGWEVSRSQREELPAQPVQEAPKRQESRQAEAAPELGAPREAVQTVAALRPEAVREAATEPKPVQHQAVQEAATEPKPVQHQAVRELPRIKEESAAQAAQPAQAQPEAVLPEPVVAAAEPAVSKGSPSPEQAARPHSAAPGTVPPAAVKREEPQQTAAQQPAPNATVAEPVDKGRETVTPEPAHRNQATARLQAEQVAVKQEAPRQTATGIETEAFATEPASAPPRKSGTESGESDRKGEPQPKAQAKQETPVQPLFGLAPQAPVEAPHTEPKGTARTALHENILSQVKDGVVTHDAKGNSQISIRLNPGELGELKIQVRMEDNRLRVEVQADNKMVKELLLSDLDRLKESLAGKNLTMDGFHVSTGSGGGFNGPHAEEKGMPWQRPAVRSARLASYDGQADRPRVNYLTGEVNNLLDVRM